MCKQKTVAYKRGRGPIRDKLLLYLACDWQNFHLENIQEVANSSWPIPKIFNLFG